MSEHYNPSIRVGMRIKLVSMQGDPDPVPTGTIGTVKNITCFATTCFNVEVDWENGRKLSLIGEHDKWAAVDFDAVSMQPGRYQPVIGGIIHKPAFKDKQTALAWAELAGNGRRPSEPTCSNNASRLCVENT